MKDPPSYPETGEHTEEASRRPLTARRRAVRVLLITVVAAAVALMIILHVAGVLGPGAHG